MQVIAVANQKGGVGKTTLVVNLAAALARRNRRVLVIDMDSQANATAALLGKLATAAHSIAHVLVGAQRLEDTFVETTSPTVMLAPANDDLARADLTLASRIGREGVLKRALTGMAERFDFVLIDTSPYLGLLTVNALVAAKHVLIPVSAEYFPMLGLQLLGQTIEDIQQQMEAEVTILGYVVTMVDRRLALTEEVVGLLEQRFGSQLLNAKIRVNANLKSAPAHRQDIFRFEESHKRIGSKGIADFDALTDEILERLALRVPGSIVEDENHAEAAS
jgi:chromosome partitioning protein